MRFARSLSVVLLLAATGFAVIAPALAASLQLDLAGNNGVTRSTQSGLPCGAGGAGSYRHQSSETVLPASLFSNLAGFARATLDAHYDSAPALDHAVAFLLGGESHVTLSNARGSLQIALKSGSCAAPTLNFDGASVSLAAPAGTWNSATNDLIGTGAYRQASGSGSFGLSAELHPGADNAWSLKLAGNVTILQPALSLTVERAHWDNLGLDYLARIVSVDYRVINSGAGDSFGARFVQATSPNAMVSACGEPPGPLVRCPADPPSAQALGDLYSCTAGSPPETCDAARFTVRYKLGLFSPCQLIVLGCEFDTTVTIDMPDALDVSSLKMATVHVVAPNLPPPAPEGTP